MDIKWRACAHRRACSLVYHVCSIYEVKTTWIAGWQQDCLVQAPVAYTR